MISSMKGYVPRRGVFEATLGCNLRCRHCGSRAGVPRPDELSTAECADLFAQLADLGMRWLTISGGEPTTRDDWPELIGAAARTGIRVGMITNAVTFGDGEAREAKRRGLSGLGLSLDGTAATHDLTRGKPGHFERVMGAMESCRLAALPFAVVSHVNRRNMTQIEAMHDLVLERGAYAWQVQLGTDMGNLSDHPDWLITPRELVVVERVLGQLIRRSPLRIHASDSIGYFGPFERDLRRANGAKSFGGCPAGLRVIGIESNGNVKGCLSIMAGYNSRGAKFVEGNIRERRLEDIWFAPGAFAYNREWRAEEAGGFCAECDKLARCRGGCMAKKVASGGGVENPMCVHRAIAQGGGDLGRTVGHAAAAAALATILGSGAPGCHHVGAGEGRDAGDDASADADSDVDTDSDSESDMPAYGMPEYGFPDTDSESETGDDYGMPDTDTGGQDEYGMPGPTGK